MRFGRLASVLARNKPGMDPRSCVRMLFLLQSSIWSSLFAAIENLRFKKQLSVIACRPDPVFIVGHWRTGSTFLLKLMSLDEQFTCPTLFQVAEPDSLLVSYPYYKPIMKILVKKTRPMDNVKAGMDEPQEDEYAIFRLTGNSPLERLVFPDEDGYFLRKWSETEVSTGEEKVLKETLRRYYTKLTFRKNGKILSKNPFHSFRIKILLEAFPNAKFIQIHRNPICVIPSTLNMWNILQRENTLNGRINKHTVGEISRMVRYTTERISADAEIVPEGSFAEIRFEDLEYETVNCLRALYTKLGLEFSDRFEARVKDFIDSNHNFVKNNFSMTESDRHVVLDELKEYMGKYSYS